MWPISTRVNNPRNDDAAILEPVEVGGSPSTAARTVSLKTCRALAAHARAALRMIREVVEQMRRLDRCRLKSGLRRHS